MNTIFVLLVLSTIAATMGAPVTVGDTATLPEYQREEIHDKFGQYTLRYVTVKGNVVSERGRLIPAPDKGYIMLIEGKIYIRDDGKMYVTKYTIDPDGVKVERDHLPVSLSHPDAL